MMLIILLTTLFLTGLLSLLAGPWSDRLPKIITTTGLLASLGILFLINQDLAASSQALLEWDTPWIESFNINFHLSVFGLSFWLCVLTVIMGLLAIFISKPITHQGFYYAALAWALMGMTGIFLSADVFLFFIFWELALLPVYFLLALHNEEPNNKALFRYVIYTQMSGLILLLSIIGLVVAHFMFTGMLTFDYQTLANYPLPLEIQRYLLIGFTLAFMIKLPVAPFHSWLPTLFASAPVPVILVGVLVKTAVFGLLRFSWPLFPLASLEFATPLMVVGVLSVLYGAILAFGQDEPKKVVAYSSLCHVGFILIGIFSQTEAAFLGVGLLIVAQGFTTAGILMLLHHLYGHRSSISMVSLGGIWQLGPRYSVVLLTFLLASLGAPVFGNFIGEWLVLLGVFSELPIIAIVAAFGLFLSAIYSLWLFQRLCLGAPSHESTTIFSGDLKQSELFVYGSLVIALLFLGLYPKSIASSIAPSSHISNNHVVINTQP
jgi:NADH-quinone oxidoreductase subunit M